MKHHQANDLGTAALGYGSIGFGIIIALAISIAINPPKTKIATAGLAASGISGVMYLGAFVIEYFNLDYLSLESQLWVRICCGSVCWFGWQIVAVQLEKWRSAKNPIQQIRKDLKR